MLRLQPTTLSITDAELKDFELRSRYRKYLRTADKTEIRDDASCWMPDSLSDDRLVVPDPWEDQGVSSPTESSLEVGQAFVRLRAEVTRLSMESMERTVQEHSPTGAHTGRELHIEQGYTNLLEDSRIEEESWGHTAELPTSTAARSRSIVVLPPPFSSRPRVLTAVGSPVIQTDTTISNVNGSDTASPVGDGFGSARSDEEMMDIGSHPGHTQPGILRTSVDRRHGATHSSNDELEENEQDESSVEDMSADEQPQTPRQMPESHRWSRARGSHTAPVSSRTRLALSRSSQSSRDWDAPGDSPSSRFRTVRASTPKTRAARSRGF